MTAERSLADILADFMREGTPIPVPVALSILRQVCDALDYAHNLRDPAGRPLGIVHRDLSPAHVFVNDTGLARVVASASPQGTFAYMAPEYVMSGSLDARADLFALGVIAHEMLANRPLFASRDARETLDRVCGLPIQPPSTFNPHVAPELDSIVLTALARDPAHRWPHAAMMRDAIQAVEQRLGLGVAPGPPPSDPNLWADDNLETRVQPVDPAILDVVPGPAPLPASSPARAAPTPAPTPASVDRPAAPKRLPSAFDSELGPEPTQIGAMPLISFVGAPLVALVGQSENPQRASAPAMSLPGATFLPEDVEPRPHRTKRIAIIAIALLVAVALVVIVLAAT